MTKYIAIRGKDVKKIYYYQTLEQLQIILDEYPLCENMVFFETEEKEAIEWSGAKKIETCPYNIMEKIRKDMDKYTGHPFKELLGELSNQKYTHVKISMANGKEFMMFIRNFFMIKGTCLANFNVVTKISDNEINKEMVFSHLEGALGEKNKCLFRQPMKMITFSDINKAFDESWNNSKYIERKKCLYIFLKSGIFDEDRYGNKLFSCSKISCPGFEMFGDIMKINFSFKNIFGEDTGDIYKYDGKEENFCFNVNQISTITPLKLSRAVTDDDWISAITTIIEDGFHIFNN